MLPFKERQLYSDEIKILNRAKTIATKSLSDSFKLHYFIMAVIIGLLFTFLAIKTSHDFLVFLFGTTAVIAYAFVVFMPYEIYKRKKQIKNQIASLNRFLDTSTVRTFAIKTDKIAIAKEYEDESDLYIVKIDNNKVLFLWDTEYNLNKKLPCTDFEIYEQDFYLTMGRQVYCKGPKTDCIKIDKKKKWKYMGTHGFPEHLMIETKDFDKLIADINNVA